MTTIRLLLSCLLALLGSLLSSSSSVRAADLPVAPAGCSAAAGTCIRIGLWECGPNPAFCTNVVGEDILHAWYQRRIADQGGKIVGVPVYFVVAQYTGYFASNTSEINSTIARVFIGDAALAGTGSPNIDFMILPFASLWGTGMLLLEQFRIPSVASFSPDQTLYVCGPEPVWKKQTGCKEPNSRRWSYAHGTANPGEQYFQPWINMLKLRKASTMAFIHTNVPFYLGVRNGVMIDAAENEITISYYEQVPDNSVATANRIVDDLLALPKLPDAFLIVTQDCVPYINALADRDVQFKSVAALLCSDGSRPLQMLGDRLRYIVGSSQWAAAMHGGDYQENGDTQTWSLFPHIKDGQTQNITSPLQFVETFKELMNGTVPGYVEAAVLIPFSMLEGAITLAKTSEPEMVNAQLRLYYQPSYYGLLTTNRFGENNQKQMVILQRDATNTLSIVSPVSSAQGDFIYPMPLFSERSYTPHVLGSDVEKVVIALVIACCTATLVMMGFLIKDRAEQPVQAAGLHYYLLMGIGALLSYISVLSWSVDNSTGSCRARIWLWTLAFHFFVDPLLVSSFRIMSIFSQRIRSQKIPDAHLLGACAGLLAPQLLLNLLWATLAPLETSVYTVDPFRPAFTSYTSCDSDGSSGEVFLILTLAYAGLLLIAACIIAFRIRRAYELFSDARPIGISMYLFALTAGIVLVVQLALSHQQVHDQRVLFAIRSVGILAAYQASISVLDLRRILDRFLKSPAALRGDRPGVRFGLAMEAGAGPAGAASRYGGEARAKQSILMVKSGGGGGGGGGGSLRGSPKDSPRVGVGLGQMHHLVEDAVVVSRSYRSEDVRSSEEDTLGVSLYVPDTRGALLALNKEELVQLIEERESRSKVKQEKLHSKIRSLLIQLAQSNLSVPPAATPAVSVLHDGDSSDHVHIHSSVPGHLDTSLPKGGDQQHTTGDGANNSPER
jgi:hypothetical protein